MLLLKVNNRWIILYTFLFLIIASIFFLSGCSDKNESGTNRVRLNEVTRSVFYAPQYVAMELGYFKENSLDVKLTSADGSDRTMTALLSGQADIGLLGTSSVISVYSQGKESYPMIFSQLTQRDGSFLMGRTSNFNWEDLKGKSVIAGRKGGVPEMTFEYILKNKGFDLQRDVKLLNNIQFNLMSIAFSRGVGDYVCLFEPTATLFQKEKSFYILKPLGLECEPISYTAYCASQKYIEENPEVIQSFTNAIYRAQLWVQNHTAEEIAKIILPYFVDTSLELLIECVDNYISSQVWCSNPRIEFSSFELMQEIMKEAGELEEKVNFDALVDNKFAENSISEVNFK